MCFFEFCYSTIWNKTISRGGTETQPALPLYFCAPSLTRTRYNDLLTSHNNLKLQDKITGGVEEILKAGGFLLKPWVRSGQSGRGTPTEVRSSGEVVEKGQTLILPNQMRDEDNKALGIGYQVEEDKLYTLASINFTKRKKKIRVGKDLFRGSET